MKTQKIKKKTAKKIVFNGFCQVCGTEEAIAGKKYGKRCDERAW